MVKYKFTIPLYGVRVTLVQVESTLDYPSVERLLRPVRVTPELKKEIREYIEDGSANGGITFRNMTVRTCVVVFYQMRSELDRAEVYSHEKRHIEDRVLNWAGVDDIESSALLAGYLGRQFAKFTALTQQNRK